MHYVKHPADSRGNIDWGWLKSYHSFSFGHYYHPERMQFGALRVLNDDTVAAGKGFATHSHSNMEIISIPLEGALEHRDSMGNHAVIHAGDIQVMSAGSGIQHSEYNYSQDSPVAFLQIWIFPSQKNSTPRYDQVTLQGKDRHNRWQQVLCPTPEEGCVSIRQEAWFHMGKPDAGTTLDYTLKKSPNGVYVFVLEGAVRVAGIPLDKRDGMGLWGVDQVAVHATTNADVLVMEVPMG